MSDTDNGQQEGINLDEELDLDLGSTDDEDIEAIKARADKATAFARQAVARAKKAEEALKAKSGSQKINSEEEHKTSGISDEVIDLRLDGFSKDEVEFIIKNGGRKILDDKNSYVSIALNTRREQRRAEEAASKVADTSQMSEIERKYTPEQLANMSVADLEKILPHAE